MVDPGRNLSGPDSSHSNAGSCVSTRSDDWQIGSLLQAIPVETSEAARRLNQLRE